ncbi:lipid-A-disaccharide synthase [Oscillatoria sp. CS-180]|uniref:lipid-A-disaccharide synthase n=1 Tax=Oscillatoria sp. CS-180 TaxID=3021720 RepID=UPI00232B3ADF|nr:lipid-A-disaccharide synthase [Oscillatoria sp. CS-180]MDB9526172.1 lipid-A-disaccharide synthase [Oscillatoria sp. CS-180]
MNADLVILSNGPGEITTWVKPVVAAVRQQFPLSAEIRISVILSPCPNATGREGDIARQYPEIDRVQDANHFWAFLLGGKTAETWDWRDRGVVLFLGGDQIYPVIVGRRLGYKTVVYAEWFANWPRWIDAFGVMNEDLVDQAPDRFRHKYTVVGDLMSDGQAVIADKERAAEQLGLTEQTELIGMLPGSKSAKLTQGMPLLLAIADHLHSQRPQTRFVIPVAPTLDVQTLLDYANPQKNSFHAVFEAPTVTWVEPETSDNLPYLKTSQGTQIFLWRPFPAHAVTSQCQLCLTTVGANTAELGSLAIPMLVLLPTQQLEAMNAWDGILGLLVNLPLIGKPLNKLINRAFLTYIRRRKKLFAWPNIWAQREVVPELLGRLTAESVGDRVLNYLNQPEQLGQMRQDLQQVRGTPGAAQKLTDLVLRVLEDN